MRPSLSKSNNELSASVSQKGASRIVDNRLDNLPDCGLREWTLALLSSSKKPCSHEVPLPVSLCRKSAAP
jgi:hypothetical protein